jgi:hypothetical protein
METGTVQRGLRMTERLLESSGVVKFAAEQGEELSVDTVRRAARGGELQPVIDTGRTRLFAPSDIRRWIDERRARREQLFPGRRG